MNTHLPKMSTLLPFNGPGGLVSSQIPRSRPVKEEEAVGYDVFGGWILRIDLLTYLAWDYIETVINLCIQMRIKETKPLIRKIRELKRIFEQDRSYRGGVSDQTRKDERQNAEEFEDQFDQDFRRLFNGLESDTRKFGLEKDYETLAIATQQAMTVLDATKLFLKDCDNAVRKLGYQCDDYHMAPEGFMPLFGLVPQFAGDCYERHIEARRLTAEILVERVKGIEFTEKDEI